MDELKAKRKKNGEQNLNALCGYEEAHTAHQVKTSRPGSPVPSTPERREGLRTCYWERPSELPERRSSSSAPSAVAQSPGREAALAWASLAQRFPASSVLAREGAGCFTREQIYKYEPRSPLSQADSLSAKPQEKPKNTGVGSLSLLQGIFPTQRSNPGLPHCE